MAIAIVALLLLGCHSWCPFPLVMRPQRAAGGKLPRGWAPIPALPSCPQLGWTWDLGLETAVHGSS